MSGFRYPTVTSAPDPLLGETPSGQTFLPLVISVLAQVGLTLGALYLVVIRLRGLSWQDLGLIQPPPGAIVRGLLLAVIAVPAIGLVNLFVQGLLGNEIENPQIEALRSEEHTSELQSRPHLV